MSGGVLPPVPDLIPISVVLRKATERTRSGPCAASSEVMGEQRQRPRRELIDRGATGGGGGGGGGGNDVAAPPPPHSRKTTRSRKSDRRRERRRPATRSRSDSRKRQQQQQPPPEEEVHRPTPEAPNPRVNPIFVWVRQEDTHIVDVKCEDYDKRNRILLTKTAQGWRAIPRTETLVPTLKETTDNHHHHHHHHHHHKHKKPRSKNKIRRRSTGVQVSSDIEHEDDPDHDTYPDPDPDIIIEDSPSTIPPPPWMSTDNINVESLLPSHTIKVKRSSSSTSPERDAATPNINSSGVGEGAQTPAVKCSADNACDVSPLDNLLAVAELEFNQQIRSGEWNETKINPPEQEDDEDLNKEEETGPEAFEEETERKEEEFIKELNELIESEEINQKNERKSDECDYNEEDDNNIAMDDILSQLEQSLRSPDNEANNTRKNTEKDGDEDEEEDDVDEEEAEEPFIDDDQDLDKYFDETENKPDETPPPPPPEQPKPADEPLNNIVESSTVDDDYDQPTDLTVKPNDNDDLASEEPTDLSIPKPKILSPRPPSRNSEAIQSPQPSGIPAVPQSPDIVTTTTTAGKSKTAFLESLLSNVTKKTAFNSEVRQKEPLDLGKCRKSASPTVTCSEEINNTPTDPEPPVKKFKQVDITLKTLLDPEIDKSTKEPKKSELSETPRLLELLKPDSEPDALTQLKKLIADPNLNIPDPMLVPKDKFSAILMNPGIEIPKLLKERPELRLPEALVFPHIMQDPNMLVLNLHHLESILSNKNSIETDKLSESKVPEVGGKKSEKAKESQQVPKRKHTEQKPNNPAPENQSNKNFSELASDIDAATQAAFNQMMWLPYLNHLEAMSINNNAELMKMFASSFPSLPFYPNQMPDLSHLFGGNRFPTPPMPFPLQQPMNYGNPVEMNMWQEAMLQANMLRNKSNFENMNNKHLFKDYMEKLNVVPSRKQHSNQKMHKHNVSSPYGQSFQAPYMNMNTPPYPNAHKSNLPIGAQAQFNATAALHQKNAISHQNQQKVAAPSYSQQKQYNPPYQQNQNFGFPQAGPEQYLHEQYQRELLMRREQAAPKAKISCKPFANLAQKGQHQAKQGTQPIDLSGFPGSGGKLKVKPNLIDPANVPKLLKHHEDVPEVGSTTASVEEMQDAHKHLWHPLFGNQKGYTSPWNWTTVTATGE